MEGISFQTVLEDLLEIKELQMEKSNNFEEYGFESNLKGEIFKAVDGWLIGYVQRYNKKPISTIWNSLNGINYDENAFNLTPIKKKWYEDEENIGKLIKNDKFNIYAIFREYKNNKIYVECTIQHWDTETFRPATKEELLSLLIKE